MGKRWRGYCLFLLLTLLIPCVITLLSGREISVPVSGESDEDYRVRLIKEGRTVSVSEYLIGVTAAGLWDDYALEAVKAQMILNRTYYYSVLGDRKSLSSDELDLMYLDESQRGLKWAGEQLENGEELFSQAARETKGLVMTFRKELAVGMYHRASAGMTRDLSEDYPYMHPVKSEWDIHMDEYLTVSEYSTRSLTERLKTMCGQELTESALQNGLQVLEKDSGGYVESLLVGTEVYSGDEAMQCLGLPSSAFSFHRLDDNLLKITCRGVGHGYGMSQYGAFCMAGEGKTATEILNYYFQNVSVQTWTADE